MNSNNEKLIKIENFKDDYGKIDNIVNALKNGKIIALPTETVYGIFALASDTEALKRIYSIKKRATTKSLTYHLHSSKEIGKFACEVPEYVNKLSEKFLPGPLMILLKKSNQVPEIVTS